MKQLIGIVVLLCAAGCGSSSPTAPAIVQVGGVWTGAVTLTTVSGGECVGTLLQGSTGRPANATMAITQTGANLTATVTSQANGTTCSYTGTAGSNNLVLNGTQCDVGVILGVRCANGSVRDIRLFAESITASVSGNSMTGTMGESWNVFVAGTATNVAVMTGNSTFTATK